MPRQRCRPPRPHPADPPSGGPGTPPFTYRAFARLAWQSTSSIPSVPEPGWWEAAFRLQPTASDLAGHRCGQHQMLTLVAYDITDPRRLQRVARVCEDWGVRVQYSVFECRLEADRFDAFWAALKDELDPAADRLVAYKICLNCAREIRCAGAMVTTEKVVAYVC